MADRRIILMDGTVLTPAEFEAFLEAALADVTMDWTPPSAADTSNLPDPFTEL